MSKGTDGGDMSKVTDGGDMSKGTGGGGGMRKRARIGTATASVAAREVGTLSTRRFSNHLAASEDLVLRFDVFQKLEKHTGCVNTASFNAAGDALVTGSDDKEVIIWDWESGKPKLSFHSEHLNNIFQAKYIPYSEDRSIVTCAADGQVRLAQIREGGKVESKLLSTHQGQVHGLAMEPGSSNVFYTCGQDGIVKHLDLRRTDVATDLFTCQLRRYRRFELVTHLNALAIAIDPRNPNLFAVAGGDPFARLYDIRKYDWNGSSDADQLVDFFCPAHLHYNSHVGITGLAFSDQSELLVSYARENIYLFSKDRGVGSEPPLTGSSSSSGTAEDIEANVAKGPTIFKGHMNIETVKSVNFFGPKCEYVTSGSDCGKIFIWKKNGELIRVMEADNEVVNSIEAHPHIPVLASCGIESNVKIWTPKATEKAILPTIYEKVFLPGRVHLLGFGGDIEYLYELSSSEGGDENDENENEADSDATLSSSVEASDSMDDEGDEDEEAPYDSISGGENAVDADAADDDENEEE